MAKKGVAAALRALIVMFQGGIAQDQWPCQRPRIRVNLKLVVLATVAPLRISLTDIP